MPRIREKVAWGCAAALGLFVVASVTGVVSGGPSIHRARPVQPTGCVRPTLRSIAYRSRSPSLDSLIEDNRVRNNAVGIGVDDDNGALVTK